MKKQQIKPQQPKRKMVQVRYKGKQIASNGKIVGWTIREIHSEYKIGFHIRESVCPAVNNQQIDDWNTVLEAGDKLTFFDAVLITVDDDVFSAPFVGKTVREVFALLKETEQVPGLDEMSARVNLNGERLADADVYLQIDDHVEFIHNLISESVPEAATSPGAVSMEGMVPSFAKETVKKLKKSLWSRFIDIVIK